MMVRKKCREGKEQLVIQGTTSYVQHGGGSVIGWTCMVASGTGSLVDDATIDRSRKVNSEI